jgi:Flp pilus assembly protein TadD
MMRTKSERCWAIAGIGLVALVSCAGGAPEARAPMAAECADAVCATSDAARRCGEACAHASAMSATRAPAAPADPGVAPPVVTSVDARATAPSLPPAKPTTLPLGRQGGDAVDELLVAGDRAFEAGDLPGALAQYKAAAAQSPKRPGPVVGLARVRIAKVGAPLDFAAAKGNTEIASAVKELRRAAQMDASYGSAHAELGRALLLLGDAAGAIDALRRGARLLPDEAEAHSALGVALLATGKKDESLVELARAAELDPGSAPRHGNYGTVLFMAGRVKEAIAEYETEVRLADADARAHSDLGTALLAQNEHVRATRELERAVELDPKRATFRSNLGYALQIQGKLGDAIAQYEQATKLDPKLASAWINLATALARDPKTRREARAALEKARQIDPSDPRVKANLEELDALDANAHAHAHEKTDKAAPPTQ